MTKKPQKILTLIPETITFEQCLVRARELMQKSGNMSADKLHIQRPHLKEYLLVDGSVKIAVVWPDGQESNWCVVKRRTEISHPV